MRLELIAERVRKRESELVLEASDELVINDTSMEPG